MAKSQFIFGKLSSSSCVVLSPKFLPPRHPSSSTFTRRDSRLDFFGQLEVIVTHSVAVAVVVETQDSASSPDHHLISVHSLLAITKSSKTFISVCASLPLKVAHSVL
ncbi:unnamed protein product [Linum trigynum]|uniref:Uncharacterized protein n=1 Tax=Linum trigynum TaxID=586398 RepID=A0AAV2E1E4_9ROSI